MGRVYDAELALPMTLNPRSVPPIAVSIKPVRHQHDCLNAVADSLEAAGYRVRRTFDLQPPEKIVILWAWGRAMTLREKHPDAIIYTMDHAFMPNRAKGVWQGGWSTPDKECGLNGWGEHAVVDDAGVRLRTMGWDTFLKPRRVPCNSDVLFCGQVFGDAQIRGKVADYGEWCRETIKSYAGEGRKTYFRPHPVMVRRGTVAEYGNVGRISTEQSLESALERVGYCAGFNSNAVAQAWMAGVESTVFSEGSMLWPVVREPGKWADWSYRQRWMNYLAWTQWTTDELRNGTWLAYHAPILHRLVAGDKSRPWHEVVL